MQDSEIFESYSLETIGTIEELNLGTLDKSNPQTIAFVDSNVPDSMTIMANLETDVKVILDPARDGVTQITEVLSQYENITAINIVSHGNDANLQLGNNVLNTDSLSEYSQELQQWTKSLTGDADILFHGCNVASSEAGKAFINDLRDLTAADIAASTNLTGDRNLGGDWVLEYATGSIEVTTPFSDFLKNNYQQVLATLFAPSDTPNQTNLTDGVGSAGDYELGMEFETAIEGTIDSIRYWKAPSETGNHEGKIWDSNGNLLASVTFTNETTSGWQEQALATPLTINANTTYVVSVNANEYYAVTTNGLNNSITNENITAVADGSNGVFNTNPDAFPTQSFQNSNYYRDVVFSAAVTNPNNNPGEIAINGTAAEDQILTATVTDADGITGAVVDYQWQQSNDNGATWTDITGATDRSLVLGDAQVGKVVRTVATYSDDLGSNERVISAETGIIANVVNDEGTVTISGSTAIGSTLSAEVKDPDGLTGASISYQWQQSNDNGETWTDITEATNQTLTLDPSLEGQQVRVNAIYTDEIGNAENVFSIPSNAISAISSQTLFAPTDTPNQTNLTDGAGSAGDYELGMEFETANGGQVSAIRYWKAPSETGTHTGKIWDTNGNLLASVEFTNETASGWQEQALTTPLTIQPNATYVVSVNANSHYGVTTGGLSNNITNGDITAVADGSNGVFNVNPNGFPIQSFNNSNYYRDIVLTTNVADPGGGTEMGEGTVTISGRAAIDSILSAVVEDPDGLTGVSISYQWQQSNNNGQTWTNITGETNQTLALNASLEGQQVRVNAIYTDELGNAENVFSPASLPISAISSQTLFAPTDTPNQTNLTDGAGSAGDYELGMEFETARSGNIGSIRYWKAPSETGTHTGKIWDANGNLLASVEFTNETASGWQEQSLSTPLTIQPNATYVVSVNANSHYGVTTGGLSNNITNGDITAVADGSNGVFNVNPNGFPIQSFNNSNYYRDIVFTLAAPNPDNNPGVVTVEGIAEENRTLTANVTDVDGLTGAAIGYQWQQLEGASWSNISGATNQTLVLDDGQVNKQVRVQVSYVDDLGSNEDIISTETNVVSNINDLGTVTVAGSTSVGSTITATVKDNDGITGIDINYQWQQSQNNGATWINIAGATNQNLTLPSSLEGQQVRVNATYTDVNNTLENIFSDGAIITSQNEIVIENQRLGTRDWEIVNKATNNEIVGFAGATSVNQGETIPFKVSLAQPGQYQIDFYRLGYYNGDGGRFIASSGVLDGVTQSGPSIDPDTRLVEYNWDTSYNLQVGEDWTSGLYIAKLTDATTGKESQVWFAVRDDDRPADIGFQASFTTYAAYNNYGGYSLYDFNSNDFDGDGQNDRAYQVSLDRPFNEFNNIEAFNNLLTWEYNMVRWLESQGYDISYFTNLDVHTNTADLNSYEAFLSAGHDEYWSLEMRNSVEQARDSGLDLAFFSANTAYWRTRIEPSSTGEPNRVLTVYKDDWALDPVAQNDSSQATNLFRSDQVNRPENELLGVAYTGDIGSNNAYGGFDFVVTNSSDPYYAFTDLENGDVLTGLVGYEWDSLLNNGLTPSNLVVLSESPVSPLGGLPPVPPGTNTTISNSVRYTAPSGAKVFSTGSIQWLWGLDSDRVVGSRTDPRAQQIAVNVFADMGARPQTPANGIVVT